MSPISSVSLSCGILMLGAHRANAKATWTINITLNSVKDGGLEISLNLPGD